MTFWESIRGLRKRNLIPRQWKVSDICPHLLEEGFSLNSIRTIPANQSISRDGKERGDYVRRRSQPKAFRLGDGVYELIDDPGP